MHPARRTYDSPHINIPNTQVRCQYVCRKQPLPILSKPGCAHHRLRRAPFITDGDPSVIKQSPRWFILCANTVCCPLFWSDSHSRKTLSQISQFQSRRRNLCPDTIQTDSRWTNHNAKDHPDLFPKTTCNIHGYQNPEFYYSRFTVFHHCFCFYFACCSKTTVSTWRDMLWLMSEYWLIQRRFLYGSWEHIQRLIYLLSILLSKPCLSMGSGQHFAIATI